MSASATGKIAVITGGASGIGAAMARELAERGAEVVIADRQRDLAESVVRELRDAGKKASTAELDVRNAESFVRLIRDTAERAGRIDYLFNNAGIAVGGEIDQYQLADWDDVFDVNLRGVVHGIHAVYPIMIAQGSGHIVNTASMAGLVSTAGEASYGATKHAVVSLSKSLRIEAKRHGVQVSVLCPGAIRTPILTGGAFGRLNLTGVSDERVLALWEKVRPMDPELFARKAIDAVQRGDSIIVLPRWWKAFWYLERLSPDLSMRVWRGMLEKMRRELVSDSA